MKSFYFDNAATTRVRDEIVKKMIPYYCIEYGNPSSIYTLGRSSKRAIEKAREQIANLIGAQSKEIYFTSGGSESDNTALNGIAHLKKNKGTHIITSRIEHPAILETCKKLEEDGYKISYLNVDENGLISLGELANIINDQTILISIMFANNEIGTIQQVEKIAQIAHSKNIIFHTDAVQAVGNIKIDVKKMGIDMLSLSSHKIYGPKGVGALYVKKGINFERFINGGHQEKNKRAGTENVAGIVGFGEAGEIISRNLDKHIAHLRELRDYYLKEVSSKIKDIKINGSLENRLPGNANISFEGINGGDLLLELDNRGICASSASACSSSSSLPSHVLTAIGVEKKFINGALRTTFGAYNTKDEVDYLVNALIETVTKLRNLE